MTKKILIIDDDPVVVNYLENIFQDNGYATMSASTGVEGENVLAADKPDLITLDLQMPDEWGPRFYRKISKKPEFKEIPVIVISGLSSSKYSIPKAVGFLGKPFNPEELMKLVRDTIGDPD